MRDLVLPAPWRALRLLRAVALGSMTLATVVACGSDGPPATAKAGGEFCTLAKEAKRLGDEINPSVDDARDLEDHVVAALEAGKAAAAKAPKDFKEIADASVANQERLVELLEDHDYDWIAAFTSDDGKELLEDEEITELQDDRDAYLEDKCGLRDTNDTTLSSIPLASGDEGIRQFIGLLEIGLGREITDEQEDCVVEALSGKLSDEDLQAIANEDQVSDEVNTLFGFAILDCGIDISTSTS